MKRVLAWNAPYLFHRSGMTVFSSFSLLTTASQFGRLSWWQAGAHCDVHSHGLGGRRDVPDGHEAVAAAISSTVRVGEGTKGRIVRSPRVRIACIASIAGSTVFGGLEIPAVVALHEAYLVMFLIPVVLLCIVDMPDCS